MRLTADGQLDPTFGSGGKATVVFGSGVADVEGAAVLPNGAVVLAGTVQPGGFDFAVARLTPDGALDASFGSGGTARVNFGGEDFARDLAVQADGNLVVVGQASGMAAVARFVGGPLPPPVARPGAVLVGGRPDGTAVLLNPDGGVYAAAGPITFFPGHAGAVRVVTPDVTGDGTPDFVAGAGPGGGPQVAVIDGKTGARVADFFAFEGSFTGGVFVAAADLDGDGKAEVVVTPDRGGGPVVAVFTAAGVERVRFLGIQDDTFRGGARAALGDVTGDGAPDLVVSAGFLGGPRIALFDGRDLAAGRADPRKLVADFFAFEDGLRNGAFVAVGDVTGDGRADVSFGGGPGGAPRVRLFDGARLLSAGAFQRLDDIPAAQAANFFAGGDSLRGGVRLALRDADGDGTADLVAGSGEGEPGRVRVFLSGNLLTNPRPAADQELDPFGATLADGVFVG
jgi:uncharacterized delta-60 repeat protein